MRVTFWGTRGSIPAPGPETVRYGGNTSCIEVELSDGTRLILDAGSGIRKLGLAMVNGDEATKATILLTHCHWDHIQGFPFFAPAFKENYVLEIAGPEIAHSKLESILSEQMESVYFPVDFTSMKATMKFSEIGDDEFIVGSAKIRWIETNHTAQCFGYRVDDGDASLVYMTDNELGLNEECGTSDSAFEEFCRDTTLLIHDAMYSAEEYETRKKWGHTQFLDAVQLAIRANAGQLAFFHYDPTTTDEEVDRRLGESRKVIEDAGSSLNCIGAEEGRTIDL